MGFFATATHFALDLLDSGSVAILPGLKVSLPDTFYNYTYNLFGAQWLIREAVDFKNAQLWMSTITGCAILGIMLLIEWKRHVREKKELKEWWETIRRKH